MPTTAEIVATLWRQLTWSHFRELLPLKQPLQREFYVEMCRIEGWSVRTLSERIDSMHYERTALSRKPEALIREELAALRAKGEVSHAVAQINRNIELIRYKLFGEELLLFELVNGISATSTQGATESDEPVPDTKPSKTPAAATLAMKTHADQIATASPDLLSLFERTRGYILAQGDDIIEKPLKLYVAFRRLKNFVCMSLISKQDPHVFLTLKLDPATVELQPGFTRDVSKIGHWGTGDLEVVLRVPADLDKAKALIDRAYQEN